MSTTVVKQSGKILQFLRSSTLGVMATVDQGGDPAATVIFYTADDGYCIYFTTKSETRMYQNFKNHNRAVLLVHDAASQAVVQITGSIMDVTDQEEERERAYAGTQKAAADNAHDKSARPPVTKLKAGDLVACKLVPDTINLKVFSGAKPETLALSFVD